MVMVDGQTACMRLVYIITTLLLSNVLFVYFFTFLMPHYIYFIFQTLTTSGTVVGIDEDHDIVVLYPSGNR